jgi:ribosome-associated heat shock protein Hsp15
LSAEEGVRLDKWLWAVRLFKTRALAVEALDGGKVHLNNARAKKSKVVKIGDHLRIRKGPYEYQLAVTGMATRRLSAKDVDEYYVEDEESREARKKLQESHRTQAQMMDVPKGKPSKKDRRLITKWKGGP